MARLLFAAHDPGGALMIGAAARELERRGHAIGYVAAGPTVKLWRGQGLDVRAFDGAGDFARAGDLAADAVVAGTGFGDFERAAWQWARTRGLGALAAIDAWTHLMRRFETPEGHDFPDLVALIDDATEAEFRAALDAGAGVAVAVVGQPHLEAQTARLLARRKAHVADAARPALVFFSEPIIEDFGPHARGFDQFQVFELAARGLAAVAAGTALTVKPHPREAMARWRDLVQRLAGATGMAIELSDATAEDLLARADAVLGMTTMVLLEAHLAGLPVLSLQPGRNGVVNPVIEDAAAVVATGADVAGGLARLLGRIGTKQAVNARFRSVLDGAGERFATAVETRLLC